MNKFDFKIILMTIFLCLICNSPIMLSNNIANDDSQKEQEESLLKKAEELYKESEKCDYSEFHQYYYPYKTHFEETYYINDKEQWLFLKDRYTCEELGKLLIEKDMPRWKIIKQEDIKEGSEINSGYVIAYGVVIFPPYSLKMDVENDRVFLNGIQIYPKLEPGEYAKTNVKYEKDIDTLLKTKWQLYELNEEYYKEYIQTFKNYYYWIEERYNREIAINKLSERLTDFKKSGLIKEFCFDGDINNLGIVLFLDEQHCIKKKITEKEPDPFTQYISKDIKNSTKKKIINLTLKKINDDIKEALLNNQLCIFTNGAIGISNYSILNPVECNLFFKIVISHLEVKPSFKNIKFLSKILKLNELRLFKFTDSESFIKEIIYNYNKNDWIKLSTIIDDGERNEKH